MMRRVGLIGLAAMLLVGVMAGPAGANDQPVVIELKPVREVNPCTGKKHEIGGTLTLRLHEFDLSTGNLVFHANDQFILFEETNDGFLGTIAGPDVVNAFQDGDLIFASIGNGVLHNPGTGQHIRLHLNIHVTIVRGEFRVEIFDFSRECF